MTNPMIDDEGNKYWHNSKGQYHRDDGPAVIWNNGHQRWHINGKLHREDGPAVEGASGYNSWYIKGKRIV